MAVTAVDRRSRAVDKLSVIKKRFERTVFLLIEEVISIHPARVQWVFLPRHDPGAVCLRAISSAFRRDATCPPGRRMAGTTLRRGPSDHILVGRYEQGCVRW
ncbi:hypothetical protein [Burkholderia cepacia]|uniref:hypothetical protein n=1 Tax=Burkholderia cepacia TaxID=292 RepID=UPI000A543F94|nr:hypothetical protein [Burkholderia cepacia]